jgi:hypothetical protein
MYRRMLDQWPDTFLTTKTWEYVKKRAAQSRKTWGEEG